MSCDDAFESLFEPEAIADEAWGSSRQPLLNVVSQRRGAAGTDKQQNEREAKGG